VHAESSVNLDAMTPSGFASYAEMCGRTLARAHARSGGASARARPAPHVQDRLLVTGAATPDRSG